MYTLNNAFDLPFCIEADMMFCVCLCVQ